MLDNPDLRAPIAMSLGAIAGALTRYYLGQWVTQSIDSSIPLGTLVINLSGCWLMGFITTLATRRILTSPDILLLITTGFLGSYTTFSSYELEAAELFEANVESDYLSGLNGDLLYWIGSPLLGLSSCLVGVGCARIISLSRPLD
ncbi:MAG: fluoride efflux transporter CrcB [Oscillatoriales cyanobacterium RM1_1_9]|nr:fluoride efflux transporter CrcB [Oscillatoriales cyanobacterium SM2_3_0]NJO44693.1 fluoride efflux transporter CrcB [Oscillatoriales cyanobacterium RM2_1_1]NJO71846.1 fluoride efflux transporter CrcB [Oscillatoriales cyanobacterium RM1_1_9]